MNLVESLQRRLQAITEGEGSHTKYLQEEQYIQLALFKAKIKNYRDVLI
jgi:hypothetical protein